MLRGSSIVHLRATFELQPLVCCFDEARTGLVDTVLRATVIDKHSIVAIDHFPIGSLLQQRTETRPSGKPGNWPPCLGREVLHSGAKAKRGEGFSSLRALREAVQRAARERSGPQNILVQDTSTMG